MAVPLYKTALAVFVADDAVPVVEAVPAVVVVETVPAVVVVEAVPALPVVEAVPAVVAAIKCQPRINHRVLAPPKKYGTNCRVC
jgi:hypothetical protein